MRSKLSLPLALLAFLLLPACAGMEVTNTGFLDNYSQLERSRDLEVFAIPDEVLHYEKPGVDWSRFTKVVVPEVPFRRTEDRPHSELDYDTEKELTGTFRRRIMEAFGKERELVDRPGADTLIVRAALTDVDHSIRWLNWLGWLIVIPPDMGGASCELEVLDGSNNERLLAFAAHRDGTVLLSLETFSTWGHAKHAFKKWARLAARETR